MHAMILDVNRGAHNVSVTCLHCGRMAQLSNMLIDPKGPSFKAYYHTDCAREVFGPVSVERKGTY